METSELSRVYPRIYHMAHPEAWPSIVAHGLLSTSALLTLFEVTGTKRESIESARRPEEVTISHPVHGTAVIRDNKPISDSKLARCLDGIDPLSYYRLLNQRVFFWPTEERLQRLLSARAYREHSHLVITVQTAALLDRHAKAVTLSAINSGSTAYRAMPRGKATFVPIEDYDYEARRRSRGTAAAVAELAVECGVSDIEAVAVSAELRSPDGRRRLIWKSQACPRI